MTTLADIKVLLVEDEPLVAMGIADQLIAAGAVIVGVACIIAGSLREPRRPLAVARDWVPFWASVGLGVGLMVGSLRLPRRASPATASRPERRRRARKARHDDR